MSERVALIGKLALKEKEKHEKEKQEKEKLEYEEKKSSKKINLEELTKKAKAARDKDEKKSTKNIEKYHKRSESTNCTQNVTNNLIKTRNSVNVTNFTKMNTIGNISTKQSNDLGVRKSIAGNMSEFRSSLLRKIQTIKKSDDENKTVKRIEKSKDENGESPEKEISFKKTYFDSRSNYSSNDKNNKSLDFKGKNHYLNTGESYSSKEEVYKKHNFDSDEEDEDYALASEKTSKKDISQDISPLVNQKHDEKKSNFPKQVTLKKSDFQQSPSTHNKIKFLETKTPKNIEKSKSIGKTLSSKGTKNDLSRDKNKQNSSFKTKTSTAFTLKKK